MTGQDRTWHVRGMIIIARSSAGYVQCCNQHTYGSLKRAVAPLVDGGTGHGGTGHARM